MDPLVIVRAIHFAACLILLAIPAFSMWILPPGFFLGREGAILHGRFRRVMGTSAVVALLSAAVGYSLSAHSLMEETGVGLAHLITDTHSGRLFLLRGVLLIAALVVSWKFNRWLVLAIAAAVLGSLAWNGHAAASGASAYGLAVDLIHLLSAGIWPGQLVPLALCLTVLAQQVEVNADETTGIVRRFSSCSLVAVGILAASGTGNACLLLGSVHALFVTTCGHLLMAKLSFFLSMIAVAARNLFFVIPAVHRNAETSFGELRQNIVIELALGTAVLILTGALGLQSPR